MSRVARQSSTATTHLTLSATMAPKRPLAATRLSFEAQQWCNARYATPVTFSMLITLRLAAPCWPNASIAAAMTRALGLPEPGRGSWRSQTWRPGPWIATAIKIHHPAASKGH